MSYAKSLTGELLAISEILLEQDAKQNLSPENPKINKTLTRLVEIVATTPKETAEKILQNNSLQSAAHDIRRISGYAEGEMELYYARRIRCIPPIGRQSSLEQRAAALKNLLGDFPYVDNYAKIVQAELKLIQQPRIDSYSKIAFAGSGPLPLTAAFFALYTDSSITCVDKSSEAAFESRRFIRELEKARVLKTGQVNVLECDAQYFDYTGYDVVFLASLIPNEIKKSITNKLSRGTTQIPVILLRSVEDLGVLLYPKINPVEHTNERLSFLGEMRPKRPGFNSRIPENPNMIIVTGDKEIINTTQLYLPTKVRPSLMLKDVLTEERNPRWQYGNRVGYLYGSAKAGKRPGGDVDVTYRDVVSPKERAVAASI